MSPPPLYGDSSHRPRQARRLRTLFIMKFQADKSDAQTITGYGQGWIAVDKQNHETSMLVGSRGMLQPWRPVRFEDLTAGDFEELAMLDVEVIIFGSGSKNRFPPPAWLKPLMEKRIGLEAMDTASACRTYNVLAGEGRNVIAALLQA